jgi:poly-gamma-glutamate synthesis protein (capsule biosynthesis protein)
MRVVIYITIGFILLLGSTLAAVFSFPYISDSAEDYQTHLTSHAQVPVHLLFVGDMMFDRSIRQVAIAKGYNFIFSCSKDKLASYDAVIGNLEGPITENTSRSMGSIPDTPDNYTFTFPTEVASVLAKFNIKIVSIGNNHIGNFGLAGIASTTRYLTIAGVGYFGGLAGSSPVYRTTIKGKNLSFVNFNEFGGDLPLAVADTVRTEKKHGQYVIVFAHWGDEYVEVPPRVEKWAEMFVHAGASLIIGTHPHVVQKNVLIDGVPVYYSLGNFIFDQYWNDEVSHGEVVEATIVGDTVTTSALPVALTKDRRTCIGGDI